MFSPRLFGFALLSGWADSPFNQVSALQFEKVRTPSTILSIFTGIIDLEKNVGKDTYLWACEDVGAAPSRTVLQNLAGPEIKLPNRNIGTKGVMALAQALKVNHLSYFGRPEVASHLSLIYYLIVSRLATQIYQNKMGPE